MTQSELPPLMQEFNAIAGVIFAQLYQSFPIVQNIDPAVVAKPLGLSIGDNMPSGQRYVEVFAYTLSWLSAEGFTRAAGSHPGERVVLTTKGLAAMRTELPSFGRPLGVELEDAAKEPPSSDGRWHQWASPVGDFFGSAIGGLMKTMGS